MVKLDIYSYLQHEPKLILGKEKVFHKLQTAYGICSLAPLDTNNRIAKNTMTPSQSERVGKKKKAYEAAIDGDHLLLHLDSTSSAVEVPLHLKNNPALTLKLSDLFNGHIEHNDERVMAQLKFNEEYFCCIVPWEAIWSITDSNGKNTMWAEDVPKALLMKSIGDKLKTIGNKLLPIKSAKEAQASTSNPESASTDPKVERDKKRRSMLKRVK